MTQQHLFMDVQSASLEGATIIEHGPHGPIVGYVEFNGRHGVHQGYRYLSGAWIPKISGQ